MFRRQYTGFPALGGVNYDRDHPQVKLASILLAGTALAQEAARVSDLATGRLLIAQRDLRDPNFAETVVLLTDYSKQSALGLIVNRPSEIPLARVFPDLPKVKDRDDTAMSGGPVQRSAILGLVRHAGPFADAKLVTDGVWFATSKRAFEKAAAEKPGPDGFRAFLGYSGWGPGQLDGEVRMGAWRILNASAALVFDADPEGLWDRLIRRSEMPVAYRHDWPGRYTWCCTPPLLPPLDVPPPGR